LFEKTIQFVHYKVPTNRSRLKAVTVKLQQLNYYVTIFLMSFCVAKISWLHDEFNTHAHGEGQKDAASQ